MAQYLTTQIQGVFRPILPPSKPVAPTGVAAWLNNSINQPYFSPYDPNTIIYPTSISTYFKSPVAIFFTNSTLGQPVASLDYLIPGAIRPIYPFSPTPPTGEAAWLSSLISQPVVTINDINQLSYPGFIRLPQAYLPPGVASWLDDSISQPYLIPYDINNLVQLANIGTYFKRPVAPVGIASWLSSTIQQPYMVPYPQQPSITFIKVPTVIPPTGYASWIGSTIGQPYIVATNNNGTVWNLSFLRAYNPAIATLITRLLTGVGL